MKYVIIWLLFLAMVIGSLTFFFGPVVLLYVALTLFISSIIVCLLQ